jgi:hypothetical protein
MGQGDPGGEHQGAVRKRSKTLFSDDAAVVHLCELRLNNPVARHIAISAVAIKAE